MTINTKPFQRLSSIDGLRGLVMLIMLLDHVRETFYLHQQMGDPVDVSQVEPGLFFSRLFAHVCAPVFVFLTGLSAFLYGQKYAGKRATASFLLKRGVFLVVLELTLVNFAWTFQFPPSTLYLQVIWAIGLSMIALSALIYLPRLVLFIVGLSIILGHNFLDGIHASQNSFWYVPWSILHDKNWIVVGTDLKIRTTYPVLPWIGVIALGYVIGPWFSKTFDAKLRQCRLKWIGFGAIVFFIVVRFVNVYGDTPYVTGESFLQTAMSFVNLTKYPPSLLFISLTLGVGLLLLGYFEQFKCNKWLQFLTVFGSVPMFFYLLHLYVLKFLYLGAVAIFGTNKGTYFGFDHWWSIWICTIILVLVLYPLVFAFSNYKTSHKHIAWLKYF